MPDSSEWDEFGEASASQNTERSGVLREFIRWYLRKPGAELPKRPGDKPDASE